MAENNEVSKEKSIDVLLYGLTLYENFRKGEADILTHLGVNTKNSELIELFKSYTVLIEYLMMSLKNITGRDHQEIIDEIRRTMIDQIR